MTLFKKTKTGGDAPQPVDALYAQAQLCIKAQRYDDAQALLEQFLQKTEDAGAYHALGVIYGRKGDIQKAVSCFENAVDLNSHAHASLAALAEALAAGGDVRMAMGYYILAIQENPQEIAYKRKFIELAGTVPFGEFNAVVKEIILECLKTPDLELSDAQVLWYSILRVDPAFSSIYKKSFTGNLESFNQKDFDRITDFKPLLAPYFLLGIKKIAVYHPAFEAFLTYLRKILLCDLGAQRPKFAPSAYLSIASALSHYCFYTEYIFSCGEDEEKMVAALRTRLEMDAGVAQDPACVAIYACYAPLYSLKNAEKIAENFSRQEELAGVVKLQIADYLALQEIGRTIPSITSIEDPVSIRVREQYEEFPYPRWKVFSRGISDEQVEGTLTGKKADILVAGCGTGREAVMLGAAFPDAQVLAVDLSLNSLAYAVSKAKEHGIDNVTFRQADILQLGSLPQRFDYIASSGVLHHMEHPVEGWKVLSGLLKDGGLMKIALYSKLGHRFLPEVHRIIKQGNYAPTKEGMRLFRQDSSRLLRPDLLNAVMRFGDYYHMSMFRDFLFHVEEHPFDIPEIRDVLRTLHFRFIKFQLMASQMQHGVMEQYLREYPDDPEGANLDNWSIFEQKHPDIFMAMYRFWCRKVSPAEAL